MDSLTQLIDTDLYTFSFLDYLTILNVKEACSYFYKILQSNAFWKNYIYKELVKYNIDLTIFEKHRMGMEPYNISYRTYYVITSIKEALKEGRTDCMIFLETFGVVPKPADCTEACKKGNIMALEYIYNRHGLLPSNSYEGSDSITKLKRRKDKKIYSFTGLYNQLHVQPTQHQGPIGVQGPVGPIGMQGPVGPTGATGWGGVAGPIGSHMIEGLTLAIRFGHLNVLQWLYEKGIKPTSGLVSHAKVFKYHDMLDWLAYINEKDKLGII